MFDNVQRAVAFHQRNKGVIKMPSLAKRRLLRRKFKQHFMSALQKNNSTQTGGSTIAERNEKAKKIQFELEQIKYVDCSLDEYGNYDSILLSFKKNLYNKQHFLLQLVRVMSVPKEYKVLVKNEIPKQNISSLVRFLNKIFTMCQILNDFSTTRQISKTFFKHFRLKKITTCQILFRSFFEEIRLWIKMCIQKIKFWLNLPRQMDEFWISCAFLKSTILTQKFFLKSRFWTKILQHVRFWKKFSTCKVLENNFLKRLRL